LGVLWNGKPVGTYGKVGCYSFQSYKIINAGEGGILVTNDDEVIVKAIYMSGAYEKMYEKHFVKSRLFEKYQNTLPAFNLRMDNISAAIIRPQIPEIFVSKPVYQVPRKRKIKILLCEFLPGQEQSIREKTHDLDLDLELVFRRKDDREKTPPSCNWCIIMKKLSHSASARIEKRMDNSHVFYVEGITSTVKILREIAKGLAS